MNDVSTVTQSKSHRWLATSWAILISGLFVATISLPSVDPSGERDPAVGLLFGFMYCQISAANLWLAMGSSHFGLRLLIGLIWIFATPIALRINVAIHGPIPADDLLFLLIIGAVGQSLLLQLPLQFLRVAFGWRFRECTPGLAIDHDDRLQFGLSHLMWFTTAIGILLGIGRLIVQLIPLTEARGSGTPDLTFIFFAATATIVSLPLFMSLLMSSRCSWLVAFCVCALIVLFTAYESSLADLIGVRRSPGDFSDQIPIWINVFTSLGVLLFGAAARFSNYRLTT